MNGVCLLRADGRVVIGFLSTYDWLMLAPRGVFLSIENRALSRRGRGCKSTITLDQVTLLRVLVLCVVDDTVYRCHIGEGFKYAKVPPYGIDTSEKVCPLNHQPSSNGCSKQIQIPHYYYGQAFVAIFCFRICVARAVRTSPEEVTRNFVQEIGRFRLRWFLSVLGRHKLRWHRNMAVGISERCLWQE